jgi:O-succinylbenzoate synthase
VTVRARWRRRTYPLVRPLRVGGVELHERSVIELQLDDRWAELSPLPGLHRETLNDLVPLLDRKSVV